jgi:glycosyltransferase involved in cell wall biosynthesis
MANQLLQLERLLRAEGAQVEVVPVNPPYRPAWIGGVPVLRAGARLVPYIASLRRAARTAQLFHVLASSGWSWHLFAAPAIRVAHGRDIPVVVNYRGGGAEAFLSRSLARVRPDLRRAGALVVPSAFLRDVFARFGFEAQVVPNIIDTARFAPGPGPVAPRGAAPHVVIARNLEPVYDLPTGLRAFRLVRDALPGARLSVAGTGPEAASLAALARELGIGDATTFAGRIDNERMPGFYATADVALNPSLADNMPISILEALACGVPVVSTGVGGVPHLVRHGETARLVAAGDARAMADEILRLWSDPRAAAAQREAGLALAQEYTWPRVRERLAAVYRAVLAPGGVA